MRDQMTRSDLIGRGGRHGRFLGPTSLSKRSMLFVSQRYRGNITYTYVHVSLLAIRGNANKSVFLRRAEANAMVLHPSTSVRISESTVHRSAHSQGGRANETYICFYSDGPDSQRPRPKDEQGLTLMKNALPRPIQFV